MHLKRGLCVIMIVFGLLCVGCSSGSDNANETTSNLATKDEVAKLNESVSNMQTQLDIMNDTMTEFIENYTPSSSNGALNEDGATTAIDSSNQPSATGSPQTQDGSDGSSGTAESISTSLANVVIPESFSEYKKQAEQIQTDITSNKDTKMSRFLELRSQINTLDDQLDLFEEKLEDQLKDGALTLEDYKKKNKEINEIEDLLEKAEDSLEKQFAIDD